MTPGSKRLRLAAPAAVVVFGLLPLAGVASAESFLDPANPCPPEVTVKDAPFSDRGSIPEVHRLNVDCAATLNIAQGRQNGTFDPAGSTMRDQMASFVVRALTAAGYTLPAASGPGFNDIGGNAHADDINRLAGVGIVQGTSKTTYSPNTPVSREQMASFLIRAAQYAYGDDGLEAQDAPHFVDVPPTSPHYNNVNAAFELLGLTEGTKPGIFDPASPTRRDQMATFLVRLVDVVQKTP